MSGRHTLHTRIQKRRGGSVNTVVALSMMALCGFAALVVDIGYMRMVRQQLQVATDTAGIAAVRHLTGTDFGMERARGAVVELASALICLPNPFSPLILFYFNSVSFCFCCFILNTFSIKTLILLGFNLLLFAMVCIGHFPIQNFPKICPKRSSLLTCPVISDNVDRAARISMASKSPGI